MIIERVRMLAPSTVIPIGSAWYPWASMLRGPRQIPAPPTTSIESLITVRMDSVA